MSVIKSEDNYDYGIKILNKESESPPKIFKAKLENIIQQCNLKIEQNSLDPSKKRIFRK